MASISHTNGRRTIQLMCLDGKRRSIRLGKCSAKQAVEIRGHIEHLAAAVALGSAAPARTTTWLASISDTLHRRIASAGLTDARQTAPTLGTLIDSYIANRDGTIRDETLRIWRQGRRYLLRHFGADRLISGITPGDASDFRTFLLRGGLAESTVRKRCQFASQLFRYAVRHRLIAANPFDEIPRSSPGSKSEVFVEAATARRIMVELPDCQWRLLFALSRWGGLRIGSEARSLHWSDIDWPGQRFTVHATKTSSTRIIPLFPELVSPLVECYNARGDAAHVLPFLRARSDRSLRATLLRAIEAAGATPWRQIWHAMRATRQTELEDQFPGHVVCRWLGNSESTARKHYLKTTAAHFAKAVQNAGQHAAAPVSVGRMDCLPGVENGLELQAGA